MEQQLLLARSKGQQAWSSWLNVPLEVFDGQSAAGVHAARHVGVRRLDRGPVGYVAPLSERKREEGARAGVNTGRDYFNIIAYKVPVLLGLSVCNFIFSYACENRESEMIMFHFRVLLILA